MNLKLPEMQFHEKKIDLFDFTSFFARAFLNFLVLCVHKWAKIRKKCNLGTMCDFHNFGVIFTGQCIVYRKG